MEVICVQSARTAQVFLFFSSSIYLTTCIMPMVVIVLSLPKVSVGLSPFSLGLPAPCDLASATALAMGPSPCQPTSPGGVAQVFLHVFHQDFEDECQLLWCTKKIPIVEACSFIHTPCNEEMATCKSTTQLPKISPTCFCVSIIT